MRIGNLHEELATDLLCWLKNSPSRREDYIKVLIGLGLDNDPCNDSFIKACTMQMAYTHSCTGLNCQEMGSNKEVLYAKIAQTS